MRAARAAIPLCALSGMIAGAVACHAAGTLVSAPPWILLAVACGFAGTAFAMNGPKGPLLHSVAWLVLGLAAGLTLPRDLDPPQHSVSTHAPAGLRSLQRSPSGDATLFNALEALDEDPRSLLDHCITVVGMWRPKGENAASVSQRIMACCAADAIDVGFDVFPVHSAGIAARTRVQVSGVVHAALHNGETRYRLDDATVTELGAM